MRMKCAILLLCPMLWLGSIAQDQAESLNAKGAVEIDAPLSVSIMGTFSGCFGGIGLADFKATASGGTAPYTFTWIGDGAPGRARPGRAAFARYMIDASGQSRVFLRRHGVPVERHDRLTAWVATFAAGAGGGRRLAGQAADEIHKQFRQLLVMNRVVYRQRSYAGFRRVIAPTTQYSVNRVTNIRAQRQLTVEARAHFGDIFA